MKEDIIAQIESLHNVVKNKLVSKDVIFPAKSILKLHRHYRLLRDKLVSNYPNLFGNISPLEIPEQTKTEAFGGQDCVSRQAVLSLSDDMEYCLGVMSGKRQNNLASRHLGVKHSDAETQKTYKTGLISDRRTRRLILYLIPLVITLFGLLFQDEINKLGVDYKLSIYGVFLIVIIAGVIKYKNPMWKLIVFTIIIGSIITWLVAAYCAYQQYNNASIVFLTEKSMSSFIWVVINFLKSFFLTLLLGIVLKKINSLFEGEWKLSGRKVAVRYFNEILILSLVAGFIMAPLATLGWYLNEIYATSATPKVFQDIIFETRIIRDILVYFGTSLVIVIFYRKLVFGGLLEEVTADLNFKKVEEKASLIVAAFSVILILLSIVTVAQEHDYLSKALGFYVVFSGLINASIFLGLFVASRNYFIRFSAAKRNDI